MLELPFHSPVCNPRRSRVAEKFKLTVDGKMISKIIRRVRRCGIRRTLAIAQSRIYERYREWSLGINTAVPRDTDTRNFGNENHPYCPLCYSSIDSALNKVDLVPHDSTLLDYGAGKGRIVVAAATRPFRRVIGVEFCPELSSAAQENIQRAGRKLRSPEVSIVTEDAAQFIVPDDVTHVTLFNPFSGSVLEQVEQRLLQSVQRVPRKLDIFYAYPHDVQEDFFAMSPWLELQGELSTGYWEGVRFVHYSSVDDGSVQHRQHAGIAAEVLG